MGFLMKQMSTQQLHEELRLEYQKLSEEYRIQSLQYRNLRQHFYQLVEDVLGKNYYNEGMDVYSSDGFCCRDLRRKLLPWYKRILNKDY